MNDKYFILYLIIMLVTCLGISMITVIRLKKENIKLSEDNEKLIDENLKFFNSDEIIKDCKCCSSEDKGVDLNE